MADKDKILELKEHQGYKFAEEPTENPISNADKVTNPIHKNFVKYFGSQKGKFSIKDIFR